MEVSVIQLRHDEFPRYETTGYPYYVNVFVMMGASFLFIVHFAFSDFSKVKGVKAWATQINYLSLILNDYQW